eukprot:gene22757-27476_t
MAVILGMTTMTVGSGYATACSTEVDSFMADVEAAVKEQPPFVDAAAVLQTHVAEAERISKLFDALERPDIEEKVTAEAEEAASSSVVNGETTLHPTGWSRNDLEGRITNGAASDWLFQKEVKYQIVKTVQQQGCCPILAAILDLAD